MSAKKKPEPRKTKLGNLQCKCGKLASCMIGNRPACNICYDKLKIKVSEPDLPSCDDCGIYGHDLKEIKLKGDGAVSVLLCGDCRRDHERPDEEDVNEEAPLPVLKDRSDRLARLTHKLRVFSSNCEIRAKIALEHSRITKNQTLNTVETSQAAILIQTYETIRHFLNNPDEHQEEETKSVTESEPMGECDFCDSPAAYAPGLCSNCAERFRE